MPPRKRRPEKRQLKTKLNLLKSPTPDPGALWVQDEVMEVPDGDVEVLGVDVLVLLDPTEEVLLDLIPMLSSIWNLS